MTRCAPPHLHDARGRRARPPPGSGCRPGPRASRFGVARQTRSVFVHDKHGAKAEGTTAGGVVRAGETKERGITEAPAEVTGQRT